MVHAVYITATQPRATAVEGCAWSYPLLLATGSRKRDDYRVFQRSVMPLSYPVSHTFPGWLILVAPWWLEDGVDCGLDAVRVEGTVAWMVCPLTSSSKLR